MVYIYEFKLAQTQGSRGNKDYHREAFIVVVAEDSSSNVAAGEIDKSLFQCTWNHRVMGHVLWMHPSGP